VKNMFDRFYDPDDDNSGGGSGGSGAGPLTEAGNAAAWAALNRNYRW
jgi:hypothetical protein